MNFYYGIVENRSDPLQLGRCQVRVVGLHTHDKSQLPSSELPWATPMQPVTSAAMNGIGTTPVGPVEGTAVIIMFADDFQQQAIILGTVGGIPAEQGAVDDEDSSPIGGGKIENLQLRTIPGPVSGRQLTFYDPENGSTNLTKKLQANMIVLGFGIPKNTFIVSVDGPDKITISSAVVNYEENIIKFESAPTNLDAIASNRLVDGSGKPIVSGFGVPLTSGTPAAVVDNIPTNPPPKSSSNPQKSSEGIKALLAACDKVGLTTKEQKCALLGIAGGESRWIPQLESFNYSESRLKQIYSFATPDDIQKYSNATKKGITREQFFSWAYGPTKRGKNFLGNKTDEDGGKYYGRGFIQLTGRANYEKYQKLANETGLNLDLVNNPNSLDDDINVSALVAALYIKHQVSKGVNANDHPGFFLAAKKAVGVNSPDIAALKKDYYEYFYGKSPDTGAPTKDAAPKIPDTPPSGDVTTPAPSPESIKTGAATIGFRDPNNKYPLKDYIGEADTNRLARGIGEGTIIKTKDANRRIGIPKAINQGEWEQPQTSYGALYPYNKVLETESGHIQEFDDSPGFERIHTYHRSGTFLEIDSTGSQVNYIVGDNFVLMESNGCIHVSGECNITVDGNTNIYARSDANVQVAQNATVKVGNNLDIGVAQDVTMAVGGDFRVKVAGDYQIQAANISNKSDDKINIEAGGDSNYLSGGSTRMDYSEGQFGNGAQGAVPVDLTPPEAEVGLNPVVPYKVQPERKFEEKTAAETPEEYNTPEGRAASAEQSRTEGVVNPPPPVAAEPPVVKSGGTDTKVAVDCKIIYSTKEFTNDFRLSKNFTLGMLIDGGVGGRHKLVDQMLKESTGQEKLFTVSEIVCNLAMLAQNLLEPALEVLPGGIGGYKTQWKVNSGYRLRGAVGNESATSDHPKGRAVDIGILLPDKTAKTHETCVKLEKIVPYDQIILEYRHPSSVWIHTSYNQNSRRKMAFTMVNDRTFARNEFAIVNTIPPKAS